MKIKEVLDIYTSAIADAAKSGAGSVSISEIERVNKKIKEIVDKSTDDESVGGAALEKYKADVLASIEHYRGLNEYKLEMLRSGVAYGQSALKSSLLINGGAAVAVLAFLGNAWSKGLPHHILAPVAFGLSQFVWGVLAAAAAAGFTYISQAGFGEEFGKYGQQIGVWSRALAIALVALSYLLFARGAWTTYISLSG